MKDELATLQQQLAASHASSLQAEAALLSSLPQSTADVAQLALDKNPLAKALTMLKDAHSAELTRTATLDAENKTLRASLAQVTAAKQEQDAANASTIADLTAQLDSSSSTSNNSSSSAVSLSWMVEDLTHK